jgi:sugar diacid utilization regulator
VEQVLPPPVFGKLVDIRDGEVVGIVCSDSEPAHGLLKTLRRHGFGRRTANGLGAGVGVSLDTKEIARLPDALGEARLALEFANPAQPLMHFAEIDLPDFLIRRADKAALRLIPQWTRHLTSAGAGQSDELARTIRAFADCSFNVKQTARRLDVHTNTVYFRLNRINKLTGIDPRTFSGTSLLLTALKLLEAHANEPLN